MPPLHATDTEVRKTLWWSASATRLAFPRTAKKYNARIGFLGSQELLWALQPECELFLMTRANWRTAILTGLLDMILIEPCSWDAVGEWRNAVFDGQAVDAEVEALVGFARSAGVPVAGWITTDADYYGIQGSLSRLFDVAFCSDSVFVERLSATGIEARHLPAAIQPATHNGFRETGEPETEVPPVLFDGWSSILKSPALADRIRTLVPFGIGIIESRFHIRSNRRDDTPELSSSILGSVCPRDHLYLLKRTRVLVQDEGGSMSRQTNERLALQAAACRTVVLYRGRLAPYDLRRDFARQFDDWSDLVAFLSRLQQDRLLWLREAQLAWRAAHDRHAIGDALGIMMRAVGLPCEAKLAKASVVTPTMRPWLLERVLRQFRDQTWPAKELTIVANSNDPSAWQTERVNSEQGEAIVFLPLEHSTGTALNIGALRSSGEYVLKMDDDDFYGENYVKDMMLSARCVDADVMGKVGVFVYSEEYGSTFQRSINRDEPFVSFAERHTSSTRLYSLAGFTHMCRRDLLASIGYGETAYGFADTAFLMRACERGTLTIAACDPMNAVLVRRQDLLSHTWRRRLGWDSDKLEPLGVDVGALMV